METTNIKIKPTDDASKWKMIRLITNLSEIEGLELNHSGKLEAKISEASNILEIKPASGHEIYNFEFAGVYIDKGYFPHVSVYDGKTEYRFEF